MLRRMPGESLTAFLGRSYVHEARASRAQVIRLMATPFVLGHLLLGAGLGLVIGSVVGVATGEFSKILERWLAAGVSLALFAAPVGLLGVAAWDRNRRRHRR